jgi:polyferredoxin
MTIQQLSSFLADLVLVLHFALVLFVIGGLAWILIGNRLRLPGANAPWFRVLHLLAIAVVVAQAWLGAACPLTLLEDWLRDAARQPGRDGTFIQYWVGRLLFYRAPPWVFVTAYSLFGLAVLAAWWLHPPRRGAVASRTGKREHGDRE